MKALILIILTIAILYTNSNIAGSIWVHRISSGCIDTLIIKPSGKVTEYECEMNYTFKGWYVISKDTLITTEKDDSHSEDGGKPVYYKAKYIIRKNLLYLLASGEVINGKWAYDHIKLKENAYYKRIK